MTHLPFFQPESLEVEVATYPEAPCLTVWKLRSTENLAFQKGGIYTHKNPMQ